MVVVPAGVAVVIVVLPGTTAGIVSGVVVVVVVVTERVGAGGGGAETVCESGPEAQPARRPQNARTGVSRLITRTEVKRSGKIVIFVFIVAKYTSRASSTMGCYTKEQ
jgi:hypothetical protein